MRAAQKIISPETGQETSRHISGAERIVRENELAAAAQTLIQRALAHGLGEPDSIHLKIEKIDSAAIRCVPAQPVSSVEFQSPAEGRQEILRLLESLGIASGTKILELFAQTGAMRGAMLLDCESLERLEPEPARGVRATFMDYQNAASLYPPNSCTKNHFLEALALASKVMAHPNLVAEICVSDDPDYVTGYVASKEFGYRRISPLKLPGDPRGGRIFLFRTLRMESRLQQIEDCIHYLQNQPVWILREDAEN